MVDLKDIVEDQVPLLMYKRKKKSSSSCSRRLKALFLYERTSLMSKITNPVSLIPFGHILVWITISQVPVHLIDVVASIAGHSEGFDYLASNKRKNYLKIIQDQLSRTVWMT